MITHIFLYKFNEGELNIFQSSHSIFDCFISFIIGYKENEHRIFLKKEAHNGTS